MATSIALPPFSSCSPRFLYYYTNLSLTRSPFKLSTNNYFSTKPISLKSLTHSTPLPLLHFRPPFAATAVEVSGETQEDENETTSEEEDGDSGLEETNELGRLYVGNLPYTMVSSQLTEIFSEAGRVVSADVMYDRVTNRSRGFAFVTMGSTEEAEEAIRIFNGSQVGGRTAKVNFPEVPKGGENEIMQTIIRNNDKNFVDSEHKIYAGNLGWDVTSQSLKDAFANQPGILSAKVVYDRNLRRSRGYGFVTFKSAEDAELAISTMNGVEVEGRPLRLNRATGTGKTRTPPSPSAEEDSEMNIGSGESISSSATEETEL